jgi:hypothetical protein
MSPTTYTSREPEPHRFFVARYDEIELHRLESQSSCLVQRMLAHGRSNAAATSFLFDHINARNNFMEDLPDRILIARFGFTYVKHKIQSFISDTFQG